MTKKKFLLYFFCLTCIRLFCNENECKVNEFEEIFFNKEFSTSVDFIEKTYNTFWICKNPFSDLQMQSNDYITSNTPGFIFLPNSTVLVVNIQASLNLFDVENYNIEYKITGIDGLYKMNKIPEEHYQVAIYELWLEKNVLKAKFISENQSLAKDYFLKQSFWNEIIFENLN